MQWIADSLFVGNKLVAGELRTSDGVRIDLRNIKSPIIVFCSWGDDITPPQQALGWIPDLYDDDRQIVANGQTIVYSLHQSIGHLGIFVSGKVASKEHDEFTDCMDLIDLMPPGLYEAVITEVDEDTANPALIEGRYLFRLEPRTLDDIRTIVANNPEDDRRFVTAARVSEINLALYRTLVAPMVRALSTSESARALRKRHPNRLRFDMFSNENPMMRMFEALAEKTRAGTQAGGTRQSLAGDGTCHVVVDQHVAESVRRRSRCHGREDVPRSLWITAAAGDGRVSARATPSDSSACRAGSGPRGGRCPAVRRARRTLRIGRAAEAALRSFIYVRLADGAGGDERGLAILKAYPQFAAAGIAANDGPAQADPEGAVPDPPSRRGTRRRGDPAAAAPRARSSGGRCWTGLRQMIEVHGPISEEAGRRLARIEKLFDLKSQTSEKEGVNA